MPNAVTVQVTTKGKSPLSFIRDVSGKIHFEFQEKLVELGELTAERMGELIKQSIKRPGSTGRLENSIKSELLGTAAGVHIGIGNITDLPPYWEVLNDGGYVPPANLGYFAAGNPPIKGGNGEQWTHTGAKSDFLMIPKKAIEPVNYIGISSQELARHIDNEITRLLQEEQQAGS